MKFALTILSAAAGLLLVTACANPPREKLEAAEKAVKEAQESGAATYMAEDFAKLEGMLASAKKEVADQEAKFVFLRDYGKAEQLADTAKAEAARVKTEAEKKKEEAKQTALQMQQVAQESVKATQELVAQAPAGKDRAALESIKADAQGLSASLDEVQKALDAGDYLGAQAKAKAIQDQSQKLATEIQTTLAKVGGAKGKKGQPAKK